MLVPGARKVSNGHVTSGRTYDSTTNILGVEGQGQENGPKRQQGVGFPSLTANLQDIILW